MSDGRKRISTVIAALGIATFGGSMLTTTPSYADPDIDDVEARVNTLYNEAEQASERYNGVREDLEENTSRLESLRADLARQQHKVEVAREKVASSVVAQSQGQGISSTSQILLAEDPDAFLSQLSTVSAYNDQQSQMMAAFATQAKQLEVREGAAQREVAEIAEAEDDLAEEKAQIDEKAGEAKELLEELEAEEQEQLAEEQVLEAEELDRPEAAEAPSRSDSRAPVAEPESVPASGSAGAAVSYALAQVGDAYVYGATGESAFDCSGLTLRAWSQSGVTLPRTSTEQMSAGTPVSQSELQPGDLVFYYSPVSHVGMYVGNGQIVHAANPSSGVSTASVDSMPYSGAVRPG